MRVERGTRSVGIDLWTSRCNLSTDGQTLCNGVLNRYATKFFAVRNRSDSTSVTYGAGPTFVGISRLEPADRDPCLHELLGIVLTNLSPLRSP